jgi:uncharacterized cupin superfamily protein
LESLNAATVALAPAGPEARIIDGDCQTSKRPFLEAADLRFGVWACTTGSWESTWENWEFFTVISGRGVLTDGTGATHVLEPGVSVMIPAGSTGVWTLTEPLRKAYVAPARRAD